MWSRKSQDIWRFLIDQIKKFKDFIWWSIFKEFWFFISNERGENKKINFPFRNGKSSDFCSTIINCFWYCLPQWITAKQCQSTYEINHQKHRAFWALAMRKAHGWMKVWILPICSDIIANWGNILQKNSFAFQKSIAKMLYLLHFALNYLHVFVIYHN